jgi:hypothetical protein
MKIPRVIVRFLVALAVCALWGLAAGSAMAEESRTPLAVPPAKAESTVEDGSAEAPAAKDAWRATISRTPVPKKGCFTAQFPNTKWQETSCGAPPRYPNAGGRPAIVGNNADFTAAVSGLISSATGKLVSVTPSTVTETGVWQNDSKSADAFTLQLNTQTIPNEPACKDSKGNPIAGCSGWQQFIYSQNQCNGPCIFIQYWLIGYGSKCPDGWTQSAGSCWRNSASASTPAITAADLQGTTLTGSVVGGVDTVVLTTPNDSAAAAQGDNALSLGGFWSAAEFNVFGDCCFAQANFSQGTTIVVQTSVTYSSSGEAGLAAPTCPQQGFTGETNNLDLVQPCFSVQSDAGIIPPAITFTEALATPIPGCAYGNGATACVAEPGSTISDNAFTASCPTSGALTMQRINLGQWETLPHRCTDGSFPGKCGGSAIVANQFVLGQQQYGVTFSGGLVGSTQTVQVCDAASRCSQFSLQIPTCASLPSPNDQFYLNPGSSPLQIEQGSASEAWMIMDGPWIAADRGVNATGVAFDTTNLPPQVTVNPSPGESGAPHGYGLMNLYVYAPSTTPPGAYSFQMKATDPVSNVTQKTTIPVQVLACTPRNACPAGAGTLLCGPVSVGCGGTVDCGSCASGVCSNSFCCPANSFYNVALNTCQPDSCPAGTDYCYDLGECATPAQCAKASHPICRKVMGKTQCQ